MPAKYARCVFIALYNNQLEGTEEAIVADD